jgi:hypothetical protein
MVKRMCSLTSRLVFSPSIIGVVPEQELIVAFARHNKADLGLVPENISVQNNKHLEQGGELASEYESRRGIRFRIVTSPDSRVTTLQLCR